MREAARHQTSGRVAERLTAIQVAAEFSFPTADIDVMLEGIERGYAE